MLREAPHRDVLIVTVGPMAKLGLQVAERLAAQGIGATVVDPRWVDPRAAEHRRRWPREHRLVVTIEDGIRVGGSARASARTCAPPGVDTAVDELGLPDEFLPHGSRDEILAEVGLTDQQIARDIVPQVLGTRIPVARPLPTEDSERITAPHRRPD